VLRGKRLKNAVLWTATVLMGAVFTSAAPAGAAIWPDQLGGAAKTATTPVTLKDRPLWDEYGFEQAERAEYGAGATKFTATAYRLKDTTGALGAFEWQRPDDARPSKVAALAAETRDGTLLVYYNYLLQFAGWKPQTADLEPFFRQLRNVNAAALPKAYLPAGNLVPNSSRYVLGPAALALFEPRIPPSVAAFHLGSEAEYGVYTGKAGPIRLAVFSYPTPQIARLQVEAFRKVPGALAKRSGPLVAVIVAPPDADAAERLLSEVRYQATVTQAERVPTQRDNIGDLILNICILAGILIAMFTVAGLVFGFLRSWIRWGKPDDTMIVLNLEDRR
jgi:hypothetical protein